MERGQGQVGIAQQQFPRLSVYRDLAFQRLRLTAVEFLEMADIESNGHYPLKRAVRMFKAAADRNQWMMRAALPDGNADVVGRAIAVGLKVRPVVNL